VIGGRKRECELKNGITKPRKKTKEGKDESRKGDKSGLKSEI
jgi:hypothetical protein